MGSGASREAPAASPEPEPEPEVQVQSTEAPSPSRGQLDGATRLSGLWRAVGDIETSGEEPEESESFLLMAMAGVRKLTLSSALTRELLS